MSVVKHRFGAGRLGIARCLSTDGWVVQSLFDTVVAPDADAVSLDQPMACAPAKCAR